MASDLDAAIQYALHVLREAAAMERVLDDDLPTRLVDDAAEVLEALADDFVSALTVADLRELAAKIREADRGTG